LLAAQDTRANTGEPYQNHRSNRITNDEQCKPKKSRYLADAKLLHHPLNAGCIYC
jgi:hypothetical protein